MSEYHPLCMRCRSEAGRPRAGTTELCFEHLHKDRDAWKIEALAARAMLLIEQHQIRGNDHPLIVVRAVQGNALQQADYADARAANEDKP